MVTDQYLNQISLPWRKLSSKYNRMLFIPTTRDVSEIDPMLFECSVDNRKSKG